MSPFLQLYIGQLVHETRIAVALPPAVIQTARPRSCIMLLLFLVRFRDIYRFMDLLWHFGSFSSLVIYLCGQSSCKMSVMALIQ
jgi:hypothetical protein